MKNLIYIFIALGKTLRKIELIVLVPCPSFLCLMILCGLVAFVVFLCNDTDMIGLELIYGYENWASVEFKKLAILNGICYIIIFNHKLLLVFIVVWKEF